MRSQMLEHVHSGEQSNHEEAVNKLNVAVRPDQKHQRQPVQKLDTAGAMGLQQQGERHGEQDHRQKNRPWHQAEQKCRAADRSQNARNPELSRKSADHPVHGIRNRHGEQRAKDSDADEAEPGIGAGQQYFITPAVGRPRTIGGGAGKDSGVRKGVVLDDPVANFKMPPDIEIEHGELQQHGAGCHGGEQTGQDEHLDQPSLQ